MNKFHKNHDGWVEFLIPVIHPHLENLEKLLNITGNLHEFATTATLTSPNENKPATHTSYS